MYNRSKGSLGFNIWTVFSDVAFGFMIIILLLFMRSLAELKAQQEELRDLASYAEAAKNDRDEIQKELKEARLLHVAGSGDDKGETILANEITWSGDGQSEITELSDKSQKFIVDLGHVLKNFLDKPDTKDSKKKRSETYTIIIIGHANTEGRDRGFDNYALSQRRAKAIRDGLFEKVFTEEGDEDKYKILATGYGDKHLIMRQDTIKGDRCIEIAFKYDLMDMIKGEK